MSFVAEQPVGQSVFKGRALLVLLLLVPGTAKRTRGFLKGCQMNMSCRLLLNVEKQHFIVNCILKMFNRWYLYLLKAENKY